MYYIGIDLGWKVYPQPKVGRSAIAVLNERCEIELMANVTDNEEILTRIRDYTHQGCVIGIDAPLVVRNKTGSRACEKELLRKGIAIYPANREWLIRRFGGIRGKDLVVAFKEIGIELLCNIKELKKRGLFEIYPYASLKRIFYPGKQRVPLYKKGRIQDRRMALKTMLNDLSGKRSKTYPQPFGLIPRDLLPRLKTPELDRFGDRLDALIGAFTVYLYAVYKDKGGEIIGDLKNGYVLIPRELK